MKSRTMLLLGCLLVLCPRARSQRLVYSLTYVDTPASRRARFANVSPVPGFRSKQQELALERITWKTDIYSVSVASGKRVQLFSDEHSNLELKGGGVVSPAGKAYMAGTWREWMAKPYPGFQSEQGVYEISLDGSGHVHRVLGLRQNQSTTLMSPQSNKAALEIFTGREWRIFIYSVPQWQLLDEWSLSPLIKSHCPDCDPLSYGWLADGERIYVELGLVGEESADHPNVGNTTYILSQTGANLGPVPPVASALDLPGYVPLPGTGPECVGHLPDGSWVCEEFAGPKGGPFSNSKPYLVIFNPRSKSRKQFPLKSNIGLAVISPTGRYLSFVREHVAPDYRSEEQLWVMDLESGAEKEIYSTSPTQGPTSTEPNVSLRLLGWLDRN